MSKARPPVKFIDRFDIGLGSAAVVTFVAIVFSIILFSLQQEMALMLFFAHGMFLFITGTGLYEEIGQPFEKHPEPHFEAGYILGAALSIILVKIAELSLGAYFMAAIHR